MNSATIVEFASASGHRLGVVTGEVGKKKLIVLAETGDEMRPERDDVTLELGPSRLDPTASARVVEMLRQLRGRVEALGQEADLALAWELASELGETMSCAQLADLMFSSSEPPAILATLEALRRDNLYFKQKRDRFEPRPKAQVQVLLDAREAEQRKEQARQTFIGRVLEILQAPGSERRELTARRMEDENFRPLMHLLQEYAIQGEDFERRAPAEELLEDIARQLERPLRAHGSHGAFQLQVELGLWSNHENLWLRRYRIAPQPPTAIDDLALRLSQTPWEPESWREDMTHLLCATIDDPWTKDLDDAVSCEHLIEGGYLVGIHIADPSARVIMDTPLDDDARQRGTSIYLPTGAIAMFPRALSEQAMSLLAGEVRPAISTMVRLDQDLNVVDVRLVPSIIRVGARLSYDEVDQWLQGSENSRLGDMLHTLSYIAEERMMRREDAGAVSIDLPEVKMRVDLQADPPEVTVEPLRTNSPARLLVSEMMILGNEQMARFCHQNNIPTIYRTQEAPDEELLDAETLAIPEGLARNYAMLRKMKRGDITTEPGPHYGLGLRYYVQASSPIRRYSDLVCQRQIKAFLAGEQLPYDAERIVQVLARVDNTAREALRAERETQRYWLTYYLGQRPGQNMEAVVVEHKDDAGQRGAVFLNNCAYKTNCTFKRRIPLGSTIQVVVERADPRKDILVVREA